MCEVCKKLHNDIAAAERKRETEKARVLRVVLENHRANTCPDRHYGAILWRNGEKWVVKE